MNREEEEEVGQIALIISKVDTLCNVLNKLTNRLTPVAKVVAHPPCEDCEEFHHLNMPCPFFTRIEMEYVNIPSSLMNYTLTLII